MRRVLTLGTTALASVAIASPALAHQDPNNPTTSEEHNHAVTYCRASTEHPGEGDVTTSKQPPEGWHECEEGEAAGYEDARNKRYADQRAAREAQSKQFQANIDREQAEADKLEEQSKLCDRQPSACSPYSSVSPAKPAAPKAVSYAAAPKAVSYAAARQEKVSRHGNPAGVEVRPVADRPEDEGDEGLEDAIDVPDTDGFALIDPALRPSPRNLVWFSFVAMAAIASLGYGLWRILFVGGV